MRKLLIISILGIFIMSAMANLVTSEDKTIDTVDFYVETDDQMIAVSTTTIPIENGYNDTVNLMVYNNATYNDIRIKATAGPSPDGNYPSEVYIDLGNNDRYEYYFGGDGSGNWGEQFLIKDSNMNDRTSLVVIPSDPGTNTAYLKLPSKAVVTSTNITVESTGVADFEVKLNAGIDEIDWGYSYFYSYNYGSNGYGYFYGYRSAGNYMMPGYYNQPLASLGYSGYPYHRGYLKFDPDDSSFTLPPGKTLASVALKAPIRIYPQYGQPPGYTRGYHSMPRTYQAHQLNGWLPSDYSYRVTSSSSYTSVHPGYVTNPVGTWDGGEYHGSSYSARMFYPEMDITDLFLGWKDGSINNNGLMMMMTSEYDRDDYQNGYSTSSVSASYYYNYRYGQMYSPQYSSTA
ncbi:MAG: hypothetical protein KAH57_00965, partial [Thermoplasmata archaeon]|nr:hypothetical protein [Thermoplasmata archaeon]